MKKTTINMTISYSVANTKDSIEDAIAREIHEVVILRDASEAKKETLRAFVKENLAAIDIPKVEATLKANGYSKQRICDLLQEFGIVREDDMTRKGAKGRKAAKASRAAKSGKIDDKVKQAESALLKLCNNDRELFRAVINRLFRNK